MMETTYNVRIWRIEVREGKKRTSYRVRWLVASRRFVESITTWTLAESFRADLGSAARKGEAFYVATGLPRVDETDDGESDLVRSGVPVR